MDPLTLIGIGGAFFLLFVGVIMEGTNPAALIGIPAFIIVIVPTILVSAAGLTKADIPTVIAMMKKALMGSVESAADSIALLVSFADTARKEGLLALEEPSRSLEDPFLRKGINLAVDGTDPDELREILEADIHSRKLEDKVAHKFFTDMGGFAPTLGIVGAVTGLIHVLGNLADPASAGEGIAGAFVATFYGVAFANIVFLPIGNKIKRVADAEAERMELLLEGILAIQAGANPRVVEEKLVAHLPPAERENYAEPEAA
ncbi:MAG: flagellar motor protein [Acidimicrobiia bacterium]